MSDVSTAPAPTSTPALSEPVWRTLGIANFQSIGQLKMPLGKLTIIVGPSNSGKSALVRALKMLLWNSTSPSYVRVGSASASVVLETAHAVVKLQRGPSPVGAKYTIVSAEHPQGAEYPKAGKDVPADVARLLHIPPPNEGSSLNFAGQFDRPFLLDDSGARVARLLGELTNVTLIFEAVREAIRRQREQGRLLTVRQADLETVKLELAEHADLPQRLAAIKQAEASVAALQQVEEKAGRLSMQVAAIKAARQTLAEITPPLQPDPEQVAALEATLASVQRLSELVLGTRSQQAAVAKLAELTPKAQALLTEAQEVASQAESEALRLAGLCPTCGQPVPDALHPVQGS